MTYWFTYLTILIIALALGGKLLHFWHRTNRAWRVNLTLSCLAIFLTCMSLEFYFKVFFAQSDAFRYTLASQNWYDRYWQENSLGYRDRDWTAADLKDKIKVMVVGDSFVAGSGIANPSDRFANQLGRLLGNDYAVMVVASPGWDTGDEIKAITTYPYKPNVLILSYYLNDIEGTAYATGAQRPPIRQDPPVWLAPLVDNSYAFNFLYWRWIRLGPQEWAQIYWEDWLKKIYADPNIRWRHQQELLKIAQGAASEKISLFVVVFPNMAAVQESQAMTQPIIELFEKQHVPILDVATLVAGRSSQNITVNGVDAHPNEMVNLLVAQRLFEMIKQQTNVK